MRLFADSPFPPISFFRNISVYDYRCKDNASFNDKLVIRRNAERIHSRVDNAYNNRSRKGSSDGTDAA